MRCGADELPSMMWVMLVIACLTGPHVTQLHIPLSTSRVAGHMWVQARTVGPQGLSIEDVHAGKLWALPCPGACYLPHQLPT